MSPKVPGWPLMSDDYWDKVKNFSKTENWGDPYRVHAQLVFALQELREAAGKPIVIHCAYATTGHSPKGYHPKGMAADLHVVGLHAVDQYLLAEKLGMFGGIGIYDDWANKGLHLDIGKQGRRWVRIGGVYSPLTSSTLAKILK